jgi:hypothetical protein
VLIALIAVLLVALVADDLRSKAHARARTERSLDGRY